MPGTTNVVIAKEVSRGPPPRALLRFALGRYKDCLFRSKIVTRVHGTSKEVKDEKNGKDVKDVKDNAKDGQDSGGDNEDGKGGEEGDKV